MTPFPHLSVDATLSALGSSLAEGLTTKQAEERLHKYGFNELPKKRRSLLLLFLGQFNDVLVFILFAALVLSIALPIMEGHGFTAESSLDACIILAILLLNAILGFVQEYKAEAAIAMLEKLTAPIGRVRRGGNEQTIPARELVPGDIVLLEAGDRISADGRVLRVSHLETNEASLTGESQPARKSAEALRGEASLAEMSNMVFAGTLVTNGSAEYVVTATGLRTEIGKIARLVAETKVPETPLQQRMKRLGWMLGSIVLSLCGIVVAVGLLRGESVMDILLTGMSLAVSAVPEGLPAVVTVCFALSVKRMVKQNVLVRRLDALETLGSVTVICSDKTGTITENAMRVTASWLPEGSGEAGERLLAEIAASCNRAKLPDFGDPTELGLLQFAQETGAKRLPIDEEEVPFTSEEKYMQTRHGEQSFLKGAPEKILALCGDAKNREALRQVRSMAKRGLRVLGFAVRRGESVTFVGLVGMHDPPRESVKAAIAEAAHAGIRSIMITGDNPETAQAIAAQVGIAGTVVTGAELEKLSPRTLKAHIAGMGVFARVSPLHKLKILKALQENGEIVAMSGDGVNDAPALKGAHVGIAMGKIGTQVAREASSVVLADDHFATMVNAVREGRRIYDNIRKFVVFLLRANFDEILFIVATLAMGMPLPYLPIHILWINLMTDSLPALALSLEEAEPDIMSRPPRSPREHLLAGELGRFAIAVLLAFSTAFGLFWFLLNVLKEPIEEARSVTLMAAITFELLLAHNARSRRPLLQVGLFSNRWLLWATIAPFLLQFVLLYTPLRTLFHLVPLSLMDWGLALSVACGGFLLFETLKYFTATPVRMNKPSTMRRRRAAGA